MASHRHADPVLNFELVACPAYAPLPDGGITPVTPHVLCPRCGNIVKDSGEINCPRRQSQYEAPDASA